MIPTGCLQIFQVNQTLLSAPRVPQVPVRNKTKGLIVFLKYIYSVSHPQLQYKNSEKLI